MVDITKSKCKLRHEQVKTRRRKNPYPHSNGYYVKCDYCIFYGTEKCVEYKDGESYGKD